MQVAAAPPSLTPAPYRHLTEAATAANAMTHIAKLAAAPRTPGSASSHDAIAYLRDSAAANGWSSWVEEEQGGWGGGKYRNVVAEKRAPGDAPRPLVVVGAHLDSVRGGPGANDDASGCAVGLELTRVLRDQPTTADVRVVWFDGEESGLVGSSAYVKRHKAELDPARTRMVNLEMLGSPNGSPQVLTGPRTQAAEGAAAVANAALHGVAMRHTGRTDASDHGPFDRIGVPSIVLASASPWNTHEENPNYHTPRDVAGAINQPLLEQLTDAAVAHVATVAGVPAGPAG